jgi:hypothetical protein
VGQATQRAGPRAMPSSARLPLLPPRPQFVYAGKKAVLSIGNTLPLGEMPEGTIVCNVEAKVRG